MPAIQPVLHLTQQIRAGCILDFLLGKFHELLGGFFITADMDGICKGDCYGTLEKR